MRHPIQPRCNAAIYLERIKTSEANLLAEGSNVQMIAFIMLGLGAALGLRFRIFVLLPVILLGLFVCTAIGLAQGTTIWSIMLTNLIGATCLQIGYLGGALLKFRILPDGLMEPEVPNPPDLSPARRFPNRANGGLLCEPWLVLAIRAQVSVFFSIHLL